MHLHRQSRSCASRRLSVSANRTSDPLASWARFLHGWLPRGLRFPPLGLSRMRGLRGNPHRAGAAGHPAAWAGSDLQRSRKGFPDTGGRSPLFEGVRALKGSAIAIGKAGAQDGFMELVAYERRDVDIKEWNPTALEVFAFVRDSLATMLPGHDVEHIGSTSVPGLRGKGIIDVMVLAKDDADTAHIATQLEALGLQHARGSKPSRPFLLAGVEHDGCTSEVHVHVVRAGSDEATAQRGFALALRDDALLRDEYASLKQDIVASGTVDPMEYSIKKSDWVLATLDHLGLPPLPDSGSPPPQATRGS